MPRLCRREVGPHVRKMPGCSTQLLVTLGGDVCVSEILWAGVAAGALTAVLALAPVANAGQLGGVDVQKYCANPTNRGGLQGNVSTERNLGDAYSWRCVCIRPRALSLARPPGAASI